MADLKFREEIIRYLKSKRDEYIEGFESLESSSRRFQRTSWPYTKGSGGGEISVLRGEDYEKAAVNWSAVSGDQFPITAPEMEAPSKAGSAATGGFFATGVSLITHMKNPKAPTVHFNIRYIESGDKRWLGGGFDLTPMGFPFPEDTKHFHDVARQAVGPLYEEFSKQAKEYFTIKHYQQERGVGGIFFDHYYTGDFEKDLSMWKSVGDHFMKAILPIYKKRISEKYTPEDRATQLKFRGRYVEFNLIYDRGTKFGFQSGGNPEAILCSMPPLASW